MFIIKSFHHSHHAVSFDTDHTEQVDTNQQGLKKLNSPTSNQNIHILLKQIP